MKKDNQFCEDRLFRWFTVLSVCLILFQRATGGARIWLHPLYQRVPPERLFTLIALLSLLRLLPFLLLLVSAWLVVQQGLDNPRWKPIAIAALIPLNVSLLIDTVSYFVLPFLNWP
jgi:hypothetical protein